MAESSIPTTVLAAARSVVVEHLVQAGFADMPIHEQARHAYTVLDWFMKSASPAAVADYHEARQAGLSERQAEKQMKANMEALCAVVQDAVRECGLDIEIVPVQLPGEHRG